MTEDGVRIAYSVTGSGPPLLACPYLIESFALDHMWPPYEEFVRALGRNAQLIRFDMRGIGLSDGNITDFSLEALLRDMDAVVAAAGLDAFDVWAPLGGVMRAIAYAAQHPDRVRKLVLYQAHVSGADIFRPDAIKLLAALARFNWRSAAHAVANNAGATQQAASNIYMVGEWNRKSASGETFASFMEAMTETSVAELLQRVTAPTLILHHGNDRFARLGDPQKKVASQITGSHMRVLDGAGYFPATDVPEMATAIDDFLHEGRVHDTASPSTPGTSTMVLSAAPPTSFAGGRYTVRRALGEGGQKIVYLVHDSSLDRECALAVLKTELTEPDDLARIRREAQAMARLQAHTNIVTVHDLGEEDGLPYIVCEYVPGGDLQSELRAAAGPLPLPRALSIAADVCRALAVAHARGIVHRDVKAANIWLSADGSAKLGDFGIAATNDSTRLTMTGTVVGSANNMSPEQAQGHPVDARSDLYAVGCLLYELVAGRPPFVGREPLAIVSQHIHAAPPSPRSENSAVPKAVEALIMRLLAKDPQGRPDSAAAVEEELSRLAASLPPGR